VASVSVETAHAVQTPARTAKTVSVDRRAYVFVLFEINAGITHHLFTDDRILYLNLIIGSEHE